MDVTIDEGRGRPTEAAGNAIGMSSADTNLRRAPEQPSDSSGGSRRGLTDTSPLSKPAGDDTTPVLSDPGPQPGAAGQLDPTIESAAKTGTNVDTLVGRLVVDQGLATPDEVQACLEQVRVLREDRNSASLADVLVSNEFVTRRQIQRLKAIVEAERQGQKIPGYKIEKKLGAGAMATVWKAKQLSLDRDVAIKTLPRKFTSNPQFVERFYQEGRAAAQLNHPNIVQAYDVGKAGDVHYFVMEFVDGRTVHDDIVKHKRFDEREAITIVIQIAEALQHAHEKGLIHRDVKPKNLMITKEGVVKLADMGLARAITDKEAAEAEEGKAFGTPYYISPEQIRGEKTIGPPADIYSLGATLYHMVTGNVPFDGKNPSAVMHKHLKSELVAPDHVNPKLSTGISEVIEMMMQKDPKRRYQNCQDMLVDLRAVKKGEQPPIAHKDILPAADLAQLAAAEAAAPADLAVSEKEPAGWSLLSNPIVFWALVISLGLSVTLNLVQALVLNK